MPFEIKRMYKTELANAYGVVVKTIKAWAKRAEIDLPKGRALIKKETIQQFVEKVGEP